MSSPTHSAAPSGHRRRVPSAGLLCAAMGLVVLPVLVTLGLAAPPALAGSTVDSSLAEASVQVTVLPSPTVAAATAAPTTTALPTTTTFPAATIVPALTVPAPTPVPSTALGPATRRHSGLPWVMMAAAIVVIAAVLTFLSGHLRRIRAAERDRRKWWERTVTDYDRTMAEWAAYETDLLMAWQFPLVGDLSDRRCQAFLAAQQEASLARRESYPGVPAVVERFARATEDLVRTWGTLEAAARRMKLEAVPDAYRAKVTLAIELLRKGLHPSATPAERRAFVDRAIAEAGDAIRADCLHLPEKALRAIDAANRPVLVAAPTNAMRFGRVGTNGADMVD